MLKVAKRILITLWYADGLHGGVVYASEIGRYFHSLGYDVYLAGVSINQKTRSFFADSHVDAFDIENLPLDVCYDIVWAHHFPILPYLVSKGLKYKRILNSIISSILPIETPIFFHENIDLITVLTDGMKQRFCRKYDLPRDKVFVLPNTAPDEFFNVDKKCNDKIGSLAVVSNHPPKELSKAVRLLRKRGIKTAVYGGRNSVRITPELLSQHDVIVSIGKTVQYALAAGIPIYNYDHFGGSGYITLKNIETEHNSNFSGRSFFTKKSAEQIADEIMDGYGSAARQSGKLKLIAEQRYRSSRIMPRVLERLLERPEKEKIIIAGKNKLFFEYCRCICDKAVREYSRYYKQKRKLVCFLCNLIFFNKSLRRKTRNKYGYMLNKHFAK